MTTRAHTNSRFSMADKKDPESSSLEFKSLADDAWYGVLVQPEKDYNILRVKLCDFPEDDIVFDAKSFKTLDDLEDFADRFRPESHQLQDSECFLVHRGMVVCASYSFRNDDLRFYDAVIDEVNRQEHSFAKGEEECSCTFTLLWRTGPNVGNLSVERIEKICAVQINDKIHPSVASFLRLAKEKIEMKFCNSSKISECEVDKLKTANLRGKVPKLTIGDSPSIAGLSDIKSFEVIHRPHNKNRLSFSYSLKKASNVVAASDSEAHIEGRPSFTHRLKQERRHHRDSWNDGPWWYKCMFEYNTKSTDQDKDIGGAHNYSVISVGNLEKELTSTTIMEFIHKEVSISSQAFVFPSLSSEFCAQGNILVDEKKNFKKLCDFLENPNHIIVSSRGRPWVIIEEMSVHDSFRTSFKTSLLVSQKILKSRKAGSANELKVVYKESKEYNNAKKLQDLYKECFVHLQGSYKRYVFEEKKILQSSDTD